MNIYQRLNEVRRKVAYIKKDARVQNYKGVSHDAVVSKTRKHFIEAGILVVPILSHSEVADTGTVTSTGTPIIRMEAVYDVEFINTDEPSDKVIMPVVSHANDHGDKAPGKCVSYAIKTAVLKILMLETGESDESREEAHPEPISNEQMQELTELCAKYGFPEQATLNRMAKSVFNAKSIKELPARDFDEAVKLLQSKGKAKEEKPAEEAQG